MSFNVDKETLKGITDSLRQARHSATAAQMAVEAMIPLTENGKTLDKLEEAAKLFRLGAAVVKELYDSTASGAFKP